MKKLIFALTAFATSIPTYAATFTYSGTIDFDLDLEFGLYQPLPPYFGSTLDVIFEIDENGIDCTSLACSYSGSTPYLEFTIDSEVTFSSANASYQNFEIYANGLSSVLTIDFGISSAESDWTISQGVNNHMQLALYGLDPLSGSTVPDLTGFSSGFMWFQSTLASGDFYVLGGENMQLSQVPVPSAVWLFGSGLIGLIGFTRSKT